MKEYMKPEVTKIDFASEAIATSGTPGTESYGGDVNVTSL